jgi:GDP-L-fucose synthase
LVNIGTGVDVTIKELAETIKNEVGFEGEIIWNTEKPDGTPRKLMDVSKLNGLGWKHSIELKDGIAMVYKEYKALHS